MIDLDGRTVLLTGASRGIGAAIAARLGEAGANLIAHYARDRAGAEAAIRSIPAGRVKLVAADFNVVAEVDALWQAALAWRGRVDVLVSNAAVMHWHGGFAGDDDSLWDRVWAETLQTNVLAPARLMRRAVKHFGASGSGVLVTVSSWAAQRGTTNPDAIAYAASKAAIKAAAQTIARGYAREGVLSYIIAPGVVDAGMSHVAAETQGGMDAVNAGLAMGEAVPPEEIADLVAYLATGRARHLSGATLDMNGASYVR
jgi:3-oxoacyl-[acyl-carrier protein] reductase